MATPLLLFYLACALGLTCAKSNGAEVGVRLGGEPPRVVFAGRGRAMVLPCGPPAAGTTISWLKDDQPIEVSSRVYVAGNGSLVFTRIVHKKKGASDGGEYRCLARNNYGALISKPSRLIITSLESEFLKSPESVNASEGDVARLTCSIESSPPASILWLKDDQPLPHTKRFTALDSGVLYISNIKQEDSGSYRCEAKNIYIKKSPQSEAGRLSATEVGSPRPPSFLPDSPPEAISAKAGKAVLIPCAVTGIPKPTTVWHHTKPDGTNTTLQTSNSGLNILRLNKLSHSLHSGSYICTATQTTKDNTITIDKKVVLIVETPAVITEKPKTQIYPAAKTVRIDCEVTGHPQPQVVWYKDGARLFINGRIKQNPRQLVLGGVVSQDTGVYQCFAGDTWAAGRLTVNSSPDQPQPPTNLTCAPLSSTQIQLTWAPVLPAVKAYTIHYLPTEGGEEQKEVSTNYTYIVQKLQPYTNYTFYIRSYQKSASEQSKKVVCSTGETVPSGGPLVNVTVTGSQCLLVSWSPPPIGKARGAITSYKVQWKRQNQSSINFELLPPHIHQYRIAGLEGGEKYMVRVMGATSLGWPEFTDSQDWINITLPTAGSSFPPPSLALMPLNTTAIKIDWRYNHADKIDGFILTYKKIGKEGFGNVTIPANSTSHIITNLESGNWYDISMKAYSGGLEGEDCSETVLVGGDGFQLPPPLLYEAAPLSPSAIRISWRPPQRSSISHYTLELSSGGKIIRTLLVNETVIEITKLNGNTVYEVRVKVHGLHNESSSFSFKLECRTPPYVLTGVGDVKWEAVNESTIRISWSPLRVPVSGYEVLYTRDLSAPINLWHSRSAPQDQSSILISGVKASARYVARVRGLGSSGPGPLSTNVYFKLTPDELPSESHKSQSTKASDQLVGILVGCSISFLFVLLCSLSLLFRKRCLKGAPPPSQHEMAALTNLQAKAGARNGQVNGMKLFPNGRLPNGHSALRITENPQCGVPASPGVSRPEAESLLNDTQTTMVELSSHDAG